MVEKIKETQTFEGKIDSLQILRGIAFLGIFASHCGMTSMVGAWGVSIFFVLSGFLSSYNSRNKDITPSLRSSAIYTVKKIGKLYELHIIMMLMKLMIPVIFSGSSIFHELKINAWNVFSNVFLIQAWIPSSKYYFAINGVSWFLSCCVLIFFLSQSILFITRKISSIPGLIATIVLIYAIQFCIAIGIQHVSVPDGISDNFVKWICYICPLYRLGDYIIGCLLGVLFTRTAIPKFSMGGGTGCIPYNIAELCTLIMVLISIAASTGEIKRIVVVGGLKYSCLFSPISILTIWLFARKRGIITNCINYKWLRMMGDLSSYSFLIHTVVIQYVTKVYSLLFKVKIPLFLSITISLVITIVLAFYYNKRIEGLRNNSLINDESRYEKKG